MDSMRSTNNGKSISNICTQFLLLSFVTSNRLCNLNIEYKLAYIFRFKQGVPQLNEKQKQGGSIEQLS